MRLLAALTLVTLAAAQNGRSSCPCVSNPLTHFPDLASYRQGNFLSFSLPGTSERLEYPVNYGGGCSAHDASRPPSCVGTQVPTWCGTPWCYVDPENCDGVTKYQSRFFRSNVPTLHFSYATCTGQGAAAGSREENQNDAGSASEWSADQVQATRRMITALEQYTRGTRHLLEGVFVSSSASNETATCGDDANDMCSCSTCQQMPAWSSSVDFNLVGTKEGPGGGDADDLSTAMCMAESVSTSLTSIAARESDHDRQKVGYMYFADQQTGTFTQWPAQQWEVNDNPTCNYGENPPYDPRFRPWYAAGATGPKDVVLVVDVSGSMQLGTPARYGLAKTAAKAILDVLTWKDFASIILFNDRIYEVYPSNRRMLPVTEANRKAMKDWIDSGSWAQSATNFRVAFNEAFDVIRNSVSNGDTSMCQKAMLFLTDGEAEMSDSDFVDIQQKSTQFDVFIFTYSLGNDANTNHMKRAACDNRGVFYPVADGGDLSTIMASFYDYFVQGQELCSASFIKYESFNDDQMLYAGCLAMYNRTTRDAGLLGVTCMDVNLIADVSAMQQESGWDHFVCQASDMTKQCRPLDLQECQRQKIRLAVGQQSVCTGTGHESVTLDTPCGCTSSSCQDDPDFVDEKFYFCHTWIGDNCDEADTEWGYSAAGKAQVLDKCRRSCGRCEVLTPQQCAGQRTSPLECRTLSVQDECRACSSKVSGVDIEDQPMSAVVRRACPCPGSPACQTGQSTTGGAQGSQALVPFAAVTFVAPLVVAAFGLA